MSGSMSANPTSLRREPCKVLDVLQNASSGGPEVIEDAHVAVTSYAPGRQHDERREAAPVGIGSITACILPPLRETQCWGG